MPWRDYPVTGGNPLGKGAEGLSPSEERVRAICYGTRPWCGACGLRVRSFGR